MFDRVQYKAQAKAQLKNNWKTPILITLTGAAVLLVWDALFFANSFTRQIMQKEIFDFPPIGYSQFIFFTLGLSVLGFCFLGRFFFVGQRNWRYFMVGFMGNLVVIPFLYSGNHKNDCLLANVLHLSRIS